MPKRLAYLTSFKHFPHLRTACLVNPTKKGIINMLINPKMSKAKIAIKYPSKLVS